MKSFKISNGVKQFSNEKGLRSTTLKDKKKNGTGFTLVELLVSIFIIVLLSGIILTNYRAGGQQFALQRSANKLAQDIRRVQEMAMSAKDINGIPDRYGIEFDPTNPNPDYYIFLFGDLNDNGHYEASDNYIEKITLEKGVTIDAIFVDGISATRLSITFKPPDPTVEIRDPAVGDFPTATIRLIINSKTKEVKVNKAGLIEVE